MKIIPTKPDDLTLQLLIRAKQLLEHAVAHSRFNTDLDRMVAIHGLDNSVEYLLRIINSYLDIESELNISFDRMSQPQMFNEINKYLIHKYQIRLPYSRDILVLRQTRNLVQHYIMDPNKELTRFSDIVTKYFEFILRKIFNINLDQLFVSSIVTDDIVRAHLMKAEEHSNKAKYLEAIVSLRDAFENSFYKYYKNLDVKAASIPAILESQSQFEHTTWFYQTITEELLLSKLGVDHKYYSKFNEYLRHILTSIMSINPDTL